MFFLTDLLLNFNKVTNSRTHSSLLCLWWIVDSMWFVGQRQEGMFPLVKGQKWRSLVIFHLARFFYHFVLTNWSGCDRQRRFRPHRQAHPGGCPAKPRRFYEHFFPIPIFSERWALPICFLASQLRWTKLILNRFDKNCFLMFIFLKSEFNHFFRFCPSSIGPKII